ncbi:unnamed protein product [Blepharisma stoltei]|uniref:Uncharacterized protein n=1 Tax=Blepharisma stoltei TaxID=1481888 RepID=A0AAU9I8L2_9CILI|nr:unnamed protein product [Blepharisma stoltei]
MVNNYFYAKLQGKPWLDFRNFLYILQSYYCNLDTRLGMIHNFCSIIIKLSITANSIYCWIVFTLIAWWIYCKIYCGVIIIILIAACCICFLWIVPFTLICSLHCLQEEEEMVTFEFISLLQLLHWVFVLL